MKTTEENNRIIAEFMGYIDNGCTEDGFLIHPDTNYDIEISTLKFHSSWDWLMPVVEKINSELKGVMNVLIMSNACRIYADDNSFNHSEEQDSTLQATYQAVVKFIEWYNEQK